MVDAVVVVAAAIWQKCEKSMTGTRAVSYGTVIPYSTKDLYSTFLWDSIPGYVEFERASFFLHTCTYRINFFSKFENRA